MKLTIISIIIAFFIVFAAFIFSQRNPATITSFSDSFANVNMIEGKQIIEIEAKGGYIPKKSIAKAGIPTILRFNTKGTFDCSSSINIPSLGINKILPMSGATDIDLDNPNLGILKGTCSMGMYQFEINFKN